MMRTTFTHAGMTKFTVAAALCLALAAPLAACGGKQAASDNGSTPAATQTAAADPSSWKTLGEALATQTESMAASWNDTSYVTVFKSGDHIYRVVAQLDADTNKKIEAVDWSKDDVSKQIEQAAGGAAITTAQDITEEKLSDADLANLNGKTGKQLVDEGWVFESYFMYGGEQTGATYGKGNLSYAITFDVTVPESSTEDGGASLTDAQVASAEFSGASQAALIA